MLSAISSNFDPLEWISPCNITAKYYCKAYGWVERIEMILYQLLFKMNGTHLIKGCIVSKNYDSQDG